MIGFPRRRLATAALLLGLGCMSVWPRTASASHQQQAQGQQAAIAMPGWTDKERLMLWLTALGLAGLTMGMRRSEEQSAPVSTRFGT